MDAYHGYSDPAFDLPYNDHDLNLPLGLSRTNDDPWSGAGCPDSVPLSCPSMPSYYSAPQHDVQYVCQNWSAATQPFVCDNTTGDALGTTMRGTFRSCTNSMNSRAESSPGSKSDVRPIKDIGNSLSPSLPTSQPPSEIWSSASPRQSVGLVQSSTWNNRASMQSVNVSLQNVSGFSDPPSSSLQQLTGHRHLRSAPCSICGRQSASRSLAL